MAPERPAPGMWAPPAPGGGDARPAAGGVALEVRDDPPVAGRPPPVRVRLLEVLFLAGLAGVFLVNAVAAVAQPSDFTSLVAKSAIAQWLGISPGGWLAPLIFVNDLLLGLGLVGAIWARHTVRTVILAWAGVWCFAVTVIKLTALNAFP
jgi:hypothetical protein